MPRALVIELWGLGDATLATTAINALRLDGYEVTVLCKAGSAELLSGTFPEVRYEILNVPWTAFRGKYRLWRWPWGTLLRAIRNLRRQKFDLALGWRRDPRDHFLMWLSGARRRAGRPAKGSQIFLTHLASEKPLPRHSVECWRDVLEAVGISSADAAPLLNTRRSPTDPTFLPKFVIHCGAQQPVRRWPYFRELIHRLRGMYKFHLILMPDPDGYGAELADVADETLPSCTLEKLVETLANADLVFCNDSAPAHIAAATGTPVIAFFGPQLPGSFAPFGADHLAIARDICAFRPCFDYCRFPEPYCLTKLTVNEVFAEIEGHIEALSSQGTLSISKLPSPSSSSAHKSSDT